MKLKKYLFFLAVICFSSCMAQSKKDLLEKIDDDINSLNTLIKMSDTRIMITAGTTEKFSPEKKTNFVADKTKKVSDSALNNFFKNLKVSTSLQYPYNIISVDKDEYDLLELMGEESSYFMHNADMEPKFIPQKFFFFDGTETNKDYLTRDSIAAKHTKIEKDKGEDYEFVDEAGMNPLEKHIYSASSFNDNIALLSPKPLRSVQYKISLPKASKTLFKVSSSSPQVKTPYGIIRLDTIVGNQVHCSLPAVENDRDIQIQAYYKDGRVLAQKGSSSNTEVTPAKRKLYEDYIKILEKAKERIKDDEIKTDKDLEKWLKTNAPKALSDDEKGNRKIVIYTFAGPVSSVAFSVSDSVPQIKNFNVSYSFNYAKEDTEFFLAMDFAKRKAGFLNKEGKWIIQPQFNEHFRPLNRYFYWDQYDDDENTYWLNYQTKTIQKVAYKIDDPEIIDGKYVKIEPHTNGKNGLADATTGKIVLPMEYDFIRLEGNKFWHGEKNEKEGIYDRNFKVLLPFNHDRVEVDGDFFFVKKNGDRVDAYDANGINLTKGKFTELEGTYQNGLLLVRQAEVKNGNTNSKYFYVDKQNNIKINASAKGYQDPEPFSAGLALVENADGDKGYINTAGNLAIPFHFKYAYSFYPKSKTALVELKDDTYALINTKGVVIKRFKGRMRSTGTDDDDGTFKISFDDGSVYNEYGVALKKGK